jgi:large subunit ribosomal protein L24e
MQCSFCGNQIKADRGLMFVKNNMQILYFCSSKCKRNMFMGREKVRWAKWKGH